MRSSRRLCFRKDEEVCIYVYIHMQQTHGHDEERQGRRHSRRARKSRSALSDMIATGACRPGGTWTGARDTEDKLGFFYILDNWSKRTKPFFYSLLEEWKEHVCLPACLSAASARSRSSAPVAGIWPLVGARSVRRRRRLLQACKWQFFWLLLLAKLCPLSSCSRLQWPSSVMARETYSGCERVSELDTAGVLQRSAS